MHRARSLVAITLVSVGVLSCSSTPPAAQESPESKQLRVDRANLAKLGKKSGTKSNLTYGGYSNDGGYFVCVAPRLFLEKDKLTVECYGEKPEGPAGEYTTKTFVVGPNDRPSIDQTLTVIGAYLQAKAAGISSYLYSTKSPKQLDPAALDLAIEYNNSAPDKITYLSLQ